MRRTKRVYRLGCSCGGSRTEVSWPVASPLRPEGGCIRNPQTSWALRLHSCRALSSQPQAKVNPLLDRPKTTKVKCNPSARVLPMCQGESVTHVSERTQTHETRVVPCLYREPKFFSSSHLRANLSHPTLRPTDTFSLQKSTSRRLRCRYKKPATFNLEPSNPFPLTTNHLPLFSWFFF
jgi:hypothetical protein